MAGFCDGNDGRSIAEGTSLNESAKDPVADSAAKASPSLAEILNGKSDEVVAKFVAMAVVQARPVFAEIFMAARSAIELADETGETQGGPKLDAKGRIVVSTFFGAVQFSAVQAMVGEAHASSLLFSADGFLRQLWESPVVNKAREGGKMVGGCKLTKVLRTATNYLRHKHTWNADGKPDEKAVLEAVGILEHDDEAAATKVLKAIGLGSYMAFEDEIADAIVELILGKEIKVLREWRNGGVFAMGPKDAETAP
jgi:hypothetical protein